MTETKIFKIHTTMKNVLKSLALVAAAAMTLIGCNKEARIQAPNEDGLYKYSFTLLDTKAIIGDTNIEWVSGDRVGMFVGDYKGYARVDVSTTPKMVVLYSNSAIPAGTMAYAYAPYDEANKTDDATADMVKITLSNVQSGAAVSVMPLAGIPFEVEEEVEAGNQEGNGAIQFMNLGSLINFKIFSTDEALQSETVKSVKFVATKPIAGVGYIDLTAVDPEDEGTLELAMDEEVFEVRVDQDANVPADKEDVTTPIKMVILPGVFEGTLTVTTDAATYTKAIPEREFGRSHSRTFGLDLAKAEREEGVVETVVTLPYEETFETNQGEFTIENIDVPEGINVWTPNTSYKCMVANAYVGGTRYETESMLVSPWIDLTEVAAAEVTFDNAYKYVSAPAEFFSLWVKTDEENAEWTKMTIDNYGTGNFNWGSATVDLSAYVGNKVKVAFKYVSGGTSSDTGSWEIKNFSAHVLKADPEISYDEGLIIEATIEDEEIDVPKLNNPHDLPVTYASSDEDLAIVDETGYVLLMGNAGTVTITASFAGNDEYKAGEASYSIKITDPSSGKVYYTKVTSNLEDWTSGTYLIVNEDAGVAITGSGTTAADVKAPTSVTITSDGIEATDAVNAIAISIVSCTEEDAQTELLLKAGDLYFYNTSSTKNGFSLSTIGNAKKYKITISIDEDGNADITAAGSYLRYNPTNESGAIFNFYKATTYTAQQPIQLYKLD